MEMGIDGLLIIDKPAGITSLGVVREIKSRFGVKKAGHIGTLDPFATGVLPVVINEGTKLVPFLVEEPKEYEAIMKLGEETATDDSTGKILYKKPLNGVTIETIHRVFKDFCGRIKQTPSMFSAIKVQGKPLYRLARKGIEVERKERVIEIFDIRIEEISLPQIRFRVSCSKGTYIRTLGKDIGRRIGCGAHLIHLRRLRSGLFDLKQAISWASLKNFSEVRNLYPWLISLKDALPHLPEVIGDERLIKKIRFGKEMEVRDLLPQVLLPFKKGQYLKITTPEKELMAILESEINGQDILGWQPETVALRPLRVFHPRSIYFLSE